MSKIHTAINLIIHDRRKVGSAFANWFGLSYISHFLPDKLFLMIQYRLFVGKKLNLNHPKLFSEKIQWLKINDRQKRYISMVDKYEAKKIVAHLIGEEYVIENYGVWDSVEEIDFSALPEKFVIKCTHDSGSVYVCKDKSSINCELLKYRLHQGLKRNMFYRGREWPYKGVKPRIIAEKFLNCYSEETGQATDLTDYKFYCFNGIPLYCQMITDRNDVEKVDFYDMEWNLQPFTGVLKPFKPHNPYNKKPGSFDKMKEAAAILSSGCKFLRVDFYDVDGHMYFGEMTFSPSSGFGEFTPDEWNIKMGDLINL